MNKSSVWIKVCEVVTGEYVGECVAGMNESVPLSLQCEE